jgi:hypothetical protein
MRAVAVVAIAAIPALLVGPSAFAQGDLKTEPTTKDTGGPGELSTTKDTGGTTLTPGTGTIKKPPGTATTAPASSSASASVSGSASEEPPPQPSASTSASSDQPTPFERHKVSLVVGDFALSVGAPGNWPKMADEDLPTVDATGTEDAKVEIIVKKGWGFHKLDTKPPKVAEVIVVCGKASAEYWGETIRDAAFTQMLDAVEKEAQNYTSLKDIEPDPIRKEGERIVQPFHADAEFSGDGSSKVDLKEAGDQGKKSSKTLSTVKLQGVSFFGFKDEGGNAPTLLACTVTCAHLVAEGDKGICGSVIQSLEVSGSFAPPPKASWFAELMFAFKRDKTTAWLVVIGTVFGIALIVVLLAMLLRKKKPATTLTGTHEVHDEEEGFNAGYEAGLAAARAAAVSSAAQGGATIPVTTSDPLAATAIAGPAQSPGAAASGQGSIASLQAPSPPPQGYIDPTTLERRV